jgi:hypothetical protein
MDKAEDYVERKRKRPVKTLTNGALVRWVFENELVKELRIPCFIDDYNQHMGGVDLANQFREAYETHKPSFRNWWPLFYWLIDVAIVNSYRIHKLHIGKKSLTQLQFRISLYYKLLGYSEKAKLQSLRVGLGGKRVFNPENERLHYWEKRLKRATCAWCAFDLKCKRVLGKDPKGVPKRSQGGCCFCNVPLYKEGECWARFHSVKVAY